MASERTPEQVLADNDMVVPDQFLRPANRGGWCHSREGHKAEMEFRSAQPIRDALIRLDCSVGVPTWTRYIPPGYGRPNTQLMLV